MRIIHIASEMARIAKVGGLGDVILGLSRQCAQEGHEVEVILPRYTCMLHGGLRDLHILYKDVVSMGGGVEQHATVWAGWVEGIKVYLIEPYTPPQYFDREKIYGYDDDHERFTYFSRAALEFLCHAHINPDIIHLHEWQVALCAPLIRDIYQERGLDRPAIVFTMHNLEHQGLCSASDLDKVGLDGESYMVPEKLQHNANAETLNLLKGGIVYSDYCTTVSPTYAEEVKLPEQGRDLDPTLRMHRDKFCGILNGLDYSLWGPAVDPLTPVAFSHDPESIGNKERCKQELRARFALAQEERPIVGTISRLVPQKGVDLIKHAIFHVLDKGGQFVLLGTAPSEEINRDFHALKGHFADNPHVHLQLHHHEELAHLIYAGADMFIVPSLFEPCGLTQLIALRYGTVPIVRRTGGLADTVFDIDHSDRPIEERNGYTFDDPVNGALAHTLDRALECWSNDRNTWRAMMAQGMKMNFSWKTPARHYLDIYEKVTRQRERLHTL